MTRIHHVFLCAVVIVLMLAAGCTSSMNTSGTPPLVTQTAIPAPTPAPSAPVAEGTSQPGAAVTQAPGTCNADITSDPANCGGCGYTCPSNALCQQGQCYCKDGFTAENNLCVVALGGTTTGTGCPEGMTPCPDGYCYDLSSSTDNCGICGNLCPAGMVCSASTCTNVATEATTESTTETTVTVTTDTPSSGSGGLGSFPKRCFVGLTNCDGTCVNLSTSKTNCGECGKICKNLLSPTCCNGACVNLYIDQSNCGTCGKTCGSLQSCESGVCKFKIARTTLAKVLPSYKIADPGIDLSVRL